MKQTHQFSVMKGSIGLKGVKPDMLLWLDWLKGEPDRRSLMDHLSKNDVKIK